MLLSLLLSFCMVSLAVRAQEPGTNATCAPAFDWMKNEKGQTPCLVTAWLWTPCYTTEDSFVYALRPGNVYVGEDKADATLCDCNTVLYSMFAACALCQGGDIEPWPTYSMGCQGQNAPQTEKYPYNIPGGTSVPTWAYGDVTTNNTFNVNAAKALAAQNHPDSTLDTAMSSTMSGTATAKQQAGTRTSSPGPEATGDSNGNDTSGSGNGSSGKSNVGAIVGGVVGGVLGAVALVGAGYWFVFRRRLRGTSPAPSEIEKFGRDQPQNLHPGQVGSPQPHTPMLPREAAPLIYDPNDPRTFPPRLSTKGSSFAQTGSYTFSHTAYSAEDPVQKEYTGMPEV